MNPLRDYIDEFTMWDVAAGSAHKQICHSVSCIEIADGFFVMYFVVVILYVPIDNDNDNDNDNEYVFIAM